jgi:hypothetical protein
MLNSEPNQMNNAPISTGSSTAPPAWGMVHSLLRCKAFPDEGQKVRTGVTGFSRPIW